MEYRGTHQREFYKMLISEQDTSEIRTALLEYQLSAPPKIEYPVKAERLSWKTQEIKRDRTNGITEKIDLSSHSVAVNSSSSFENLKEAICACLAEAMVKAPWAFTWEGSGVAVFFISPDILAKLSESNKREIRDFVKTLLNYEGELEDNITVCFQTPIFDSTIVSLQITKVFSYYKKLTETKPSYSDEDNSDDNYLVDDEINPWNSQPSQKTENPSASKISISSKLRQKFDKAANIPYNEFEIIGDINEIEKIIHPTEATTVFHGGIKSVLSKDTSNYISTGYEEGHDCVTRALRNAILNLPIELKEIKNVWVQVWIPSTLPNIKHEFNQLERFLKPLFKLIGNQCDWNWSIANILDGRQAKVTLIVASK